MKYDLGEIKMKKKIFLSTYVTCFIGLLGCTHTQPEYTQCTGPNCQAPADYVCENTDDPSLCPADPFVNYTRTAADFREYGERTPRDRLYSQAAAGNNLSASIPPSIEDEVISYSERLENPIPQPEPKPEPVSKKPQAPVDPIAPVNPVAPVASAVAPVIPTPATPAVPAVQPVAPQQDASVQEIEDEEIIEEDMEEDIEYEDDDLLDIEVDEEVSEAIDKDNQDDVEDPVQDWLAEEGQNLKALLTEWSEQSGWRLIWNTNRNYVLNAGAMFRGRFADVSSALIRAFARARPAPIATFYKGNRVLVVETMEDENAYE